MAEWGARCIGCTRPARQTELGSSVKHHGLQCGHVYCELCLTAVQEYTPSLCPACGASTNWSEKQRLYTVNKWLDDQRSWSARKTFEGMTDDCTIANIKQANSGCSHKHLRNCDETDIPPSQKMNVHDFRDHYHLNSAKKIKRVLNFDELEKHMNIEPVADSQAQKCVQKMCNASSMAVNTFQLIDEALAAGGLNLERLNAFLQNLNQLRTHIKQEEKRIEQTMKEDFTNISGALQKRKGMLHIELRSHTDRFCDDIENVKKMLEDQLENLKGAIQLAKGLKETPSSRAYCDLNQIIGCLKSPVKDDNLLIEDLKLRSCLRFHLNSEVILCTLKNLGKIEFESKKRCHPEESEDTGQHINAPSYRNESSVWDNFVSVNNRIGMPVKHFESESHIKQDSCAVYAQLKNIKPKEFTLSSLQKTVNALPQTSTTPDVIIEEIIDDDRESCLSEISDTPKQQKHIMKKSATHHERASDQELVFVSHVVNPCHFYIQRYSKKKSTNELEQNLALYCSTNCHPNPNDVLVLGENIFVRSKEHCKWCRATITELIPMESKNVGKPCGPTKYQVKDISVMQVFLLDFGSSEVLIFLGISGLPFMTSEHLHLQHSLVKDLCPHIRKIDSLMEAKMRTVLPLAVQCALKDIVPHDSDSGWGEDVKDEFLRMVNNKAVLMKIFKEENGKLIVDLKKPRTNKITSDMPVSLRDALVFTELARFRSQLPETPSEIERVFSYLPALLPQPMTDVSIVVSHVNSPSDFYIQMLDTLEYLNLVKSITDVYTNDDGDNLEILCPVKGQACIAMYENEWYRAEVIGLPGHREVEVKYIDFGNIAKVNVKKLRKVKDEFLSLPQKGIWCKLAHIEPVMQKEEWSKEAITAFKELVQDKIMPCTVISILQDNKLSMELFDPDPLPEKITASVNSTLVEDNFASFTEGESSSTYCNEVWDPTPEMMLCESPYEQSIQFDKDLDFESLNIKEELKVRVSHVESPCKFFVQWLSSENRLKRLQDDLSDVYQQSKPETIEWCIDMYCAVEVLVLKQWRRGQVKQVVSETIVKVFYYDYGIQEEVHVSCLRILKEDLTTIGPLALAFSLKDIRPAGGSEKWTATACDVLSQYLTGAVAYLSLEGNCSKWPLPVKIFCKDEDGHLADVSNFLVKRGLALRERRMEPEAEESHPDTALESESLSSNDVQPETKCTSSDFIPEELSESNFSCTVDQPVITSKSIIEPYRAPCIPSETFFQADVSSVGKDGTIYVVQKSLRKELKTLMENLQNDLHFLGILEPYDWKKGEGCSVRGSDTMWYRAKIMEVGGGSIKVYYVDHGYIEKIPQCHFSPSVLYSDIPQFAIPCELHNVLPVGDSWQPDAVELFEEFLTKRCVDLQLVGQCENADGRIPAVLYCDGISLSHFMEQHNHCFTKDPQNRISVEAKDFNEGDLLNHWENCFKDLLLPEFETPLLPRYTLPSLPYPGQLFPVTVKHVETPNEVCIVLDSKECMSHLSDTDDSGLSCDFDMDALELELRSCNQNIEPLSSLNDFRSEMPCLAMYRDGQLYRAKFLSIQQYDPVNILVQHVDYGSSATLTTGSIFKIPANLMQYPARALRVKLAGFKPPLEDGETQRIPYRPAWSMEAMWAMLDCVNEKQLYASTVTRSPEPTVFLYEDERYLVHMPLIVMGLADLDE